MCNIAKDERRWSVIVFRSGVFNLLLFNAGVLGRYGTVQVVRGMVTEGGIGAYKKPQNRRKIIQNRNTEKNSIKTENRMRNCQNRYIFTTQLLKPWLIRYSGDKWSIQSKLH